MVMSVPSGYVKPGSQAIGFATGSKELTIKLEKVVKVEVVYTVTVLDQYGNPVSNVNVQLCTDAMCFNAVTNADGIATKELNPNNAYNVKIHAPEGYTAPEGYFTTIEAGTTELTVEITKN